MAPILILAAAMTAQSDVPPRPLPYEVRAVVQAAIDSNDPAAVEAVARFAAAAHPSAAEEIQAMRRAFLTAREAQARREEQARRERLAQSSPLDHWEGQLEIGAMRSTGSNDQFGLFAAVNGERNGLSWSHRIAARAEVQETAGIRTMERIGASWQPRRRLDNRLYGYGLAQYERDPFVGIGGRYTAGLGAGYSLINDRNLRLEVEGGPAFRRTDAVSADDFSAIAARASLDFTWRFAPQLELKQAGTLFIDRRNGNGRATTSLDARLLGPLRMRLSYELRYEEDVLRNLNNLDTTSRATLIVGF